MISYFKPLIYRHKIGNGFKCQSKRGDIPREAFPRGENLRATSGGLGELLAGLALSALGGPGQPASLSSAVGQTLKQNKGSIDATTHKAGPWAGIRGLAGSFSLPRQAQLHLCPQGDISHREKGCIRPGVRCSKECCLVNVTNEDEF